MQDEIVQNLETRQCDDCGNTFLIDQFRLDWGVCNGCWDKQMSVKSVPNRNQRESERLSKIENLTVGVVQDLIRSGKSLVDIHEETGMDLMVLAFMATNLDKQDEKSNQDEAYPNMTKYYELISKDFIDIPKNGCGYGFGEYYEKDFKILIKMLFEFYSYFNNSVIDWNEEFLEIFPGLGHDLALESSMLKGNYEFVFFGNYSSSDEMIKLEIISRLGKSSLHDAQFTISKENMKKIVPKIEKFLKKYEKN